MRRLADEDDPDAEVITVVLDNLNTHDSASFDHAFDTETAQRLSKKFRFVHTPRHGSWLNMEELELSILSRQCINRRFASSSSEDIDKQIQAWQTPRNAQSLGGQLAIHNPRRQNQTQKSLSNPTSQRAIAGLVRGGSRGQRLHSRPRMAEDIRR